MRHANCHALLLLAGLMLAVCSSLARGDAPGSATFDAPEKIAVVDLERVFNGYQRFEAQHKDWAQEVAELQRKSQALVDQMRPIEQDLQSGRIRSGTAAFRDRETELARLSVDLQRLQKAGDRDLKRKEARLYHQTYLEVLEAVKTVAARHEFTLVVKHSPNNPDSAEVGQVRAALQQFLIYHRPDRNITDEVLTELNSPEMQAVGPIRRRAAQTAGQADKEPAVRK